MKNAIGQNYLDKASVWLSGLCALHCLALPLLLPLLPILASSIFAESWFERTILGLSIALGFLALMVGFYRYHRQIYPFYALCMGGVIYWQKDMFGHDFEPVTVTIGALLIIIAHVLNIKLCRDCRQCKSTTCQAS
jgi:hypothetical protein